MNGAALQKNGRAAFTLVELLVACTVLTLLAVLTARAFQGATLLWERSTFRSEAYREGRAACEILWQDLAGLLPPDPEGSVLPLLVLDHPPEAGAEDRANEAFCATTLAPGTGEPTLVGYRAVWDDQTGTYALRRTLRQDGAAALASGSGSVAATYFGDPAAAEEETVAACVWDFTVRPATTSGTAGPYPAKAYTADFPAWVEIRFKALGPSATRKLAGLQITRETWANPADPLFRRAILPHAESFFIRVPLAGAPTAP